MPRQAKRESGTRIFHRMMRGINHQNIFVDVEDNYQFSNAPDCTRNYDNNNLPLCHSQERVTV